MSLAHTERNINLAGTSLEQHSKQPRWKRDTRNKSPGLGSLQAAAGKGFISSCHAQSAVSSQAETSAAPSTLSHSVLSFLHSTHTSQLLK